MHRKITLTGALWLMTASLVSAQGFNPGSAKEGPPPPAASLPAAPTPVPMPAGQPKEPQKTFREIFQEKEQTDASSTKQGPDTAGEGEHSLNKGEELAQEPQLAPRRLGPIRDRLFVRSDYLLWTIKEAAVPPLVTTGLTTDPQPGAIGTGSTRILLGGNIEFHERAGAQFGGGYKLGLEDRWAVEAAYMFLGSRTVTIAGFSPGTLAAAPFMARPFFDVVNQREDASLIAYPGLVAGSFDMQYSNEFSAAEANLAYTLWRGERGQIDFLGGFRHWHLEENLTITESVQVNPAAARFSGQTINVSDAFGTDNNFYGGQLGVRGSYTTGRWRLDVNTKVALGNSERSATIQGGTFSAGALPLNAPAGLLALASNSGRYSTSEFTAIPELNVRLGVNLTDRWLVSFGYSFMYWDQVWRAGDQIDRNLNPNLIPTSDTFGAGGPNQPTFPGRTSNFWAQGFHFGMEFKF